MNALLRPSRPVGSSPLPAGFEPSPMQLAVFEFVRDDRRSAVVEAVAGSGKSTTIVYSLLYTPPSEPILVLAFNAAIVKEMKEKVEHLRQTTGRDFRNVRVSTFHSLGFGALLKRWGCAPNQVETNSYKLKDLSQQLWSEDTYARYGEFVCELVSYAKGQGVGCLVPDVETAWLDIIDHHDMYLDDQDATVEQAIEYARELLRRSNQVAEEKRVIDFDDMLYLPLKWKLQLFRQTKVIVDEGQDVNPVRRAIARLALRPGGRFFAFGDSAQAIYGFTGADSEAMNLLRKEFNAVSLPLTVSYRCPQVAEAEVRDLVPEFSVHTSAPKGEVLELSVEEALPRLDASAAILCRNTAPLVGLAYQLMARRVPCKVLGREIGNGLVSLVKKMRAKTIDALKEKLQAYQEREVAAFMAKGKEMKAAGVADRVECVMTFIDALDENERTVPKLIRGIESLFDDAGGKVLTLSTMHKAKGREWPTVAIYRQDLLPSPFARQEHQHKQEMNLKYVARTRFQRTMIYLRGEGLAKKAPPAKQKTNQS